MTDLYLTEDGDLALGPNGDIAVTRSFNRDLMQQAYVRCMTDIGDFKIYPNLGASLTELWGQQQSPATGEFGRRRILAALSREGFFSGLSYDVKAIPTGPQSLRFDIYFYNTGKEAVVLSVEQELGVL